MYNRNDGSDKINALQNQFTAYLATALRRTRIRYLNKRDTLYRREVPLEDYEFELSSPDDPLLIAVNSFKAELLRQLLKEIKGRERYILLAHIFEEKGFEELGNELGMSYKAVASAYYRVLIKLRRMLGGDLHDEF